MAPPSPYNCLLYLAFAIIGVNFVIELLLDLVISPLILRILKALKASH